MPAARLIYAIGLLSIAVGQDRKSNTSLHVQSDLVLINALVTDSHGKPVVGLGASQFHLFEDGKEQIIKFCSSEDVPVSIGLVLDTSGSMDDKLELMKEAAIRFLRVANPADEYFLVEFEARPELVVSRTTDTDQLLKSIGAISAGGSTALFDAIHLAVNEMRHAQYPRKAMLIVSDGMDNHSRYTERETKRLISEVDFPIYGINVWQPQRSGNRYAIQRRDPATLDMILPPTGGRVFVVRDLKKLASTTELISQEIRSEYVLGYAPSIRENDGKFRRVQIGLEPSAGQHLKLSHRSGYYAPSR